MALYFQALSSKTLYMPNSQNRSNSNNDAGKGQPKDRVSKASASNNNPERSDRKQGDHPKSHRGDTGRSSSQGRKEASGGSINE
jgi:hypothetical protein